mmetsp:Transcript_99525/g.214741  ORF Transcript_99525/g.214741 Transcript_99525/m.214741 type:complete len:357 (+) Transcript_99525:18-1088(+)
MNDETVVIGQHGTKQVAMPLEFPKPSIDRCLRKRATLTDSTGIISHEYIYILEDGVAYKIEERILKETIYGSVHCGFTLSQCGEDMYTYEQADLVAVKKYDKQTVKAKMHKTMENPLHEFGAMQLLGDEHPNIMGQIRCMEDDDFYYSIMAFCTGGELFEYLDSGSMTESKARKAFVQILDGLEHMHSKGVVHRDMSLENLLIFNADDEDAMQIIIIDWGMAARVPMYKSDDGWRDFLVPPMGCCGKKNYIAPEVIQNADKRTASAFSAMRADVWATGVILFMLLTSIPPFESATDSNRAYRAIKQGKLKALLTHWGYSISSSAQDLLHRMFTSQPHDRPTIQEIRNHPWMTTATS